MLQLDIKWDRRQWFRLVMALTATLVVLTAVLPSWTGVVGFLFLYLILKRQLGTVEALVGVFLVVTALASSRLGYHGYVKQLRLPLLIVMAYHGLKRFNTWPIELRRSHARWALLVLVGVAVPTLINQGLAVRDPAIVLVPGAWFIFGTLAFHATEAELRRRWDLFAILLPAAFLSFFIFGALRGGDAMLGARFRGWMGNPNEMSHWWLAMFAVLMAGIGGARNRKWFAGLIVLTILLYIRSGSRSPLGLSAVVAFGGLLLSNDLSRGMRYLIGVAIVAVAIALPFLNTETLAGVLPENVLRTETLDEGGGRFVAWQFGWEELMRRPWWGGGAGFEERYYTSYKEVLSLLGHQGLSHNSYLAFGLNYGIPLGAALLLGLIRRLGMLNRRMLFVALVPFVLATFVEGVLTSPLNAVTPAWFFAAAWMGQILQHRPDHAN